MTSLHLANEGRVSSATFSNQYLSAAHAIHKKEMGCFGQISVFPLFIDFHVEKLDDGQISPPSPTRAIQNWQLQCAQKISIR